MKRHKLYWEPYDYPSLLTYDKTKFKAELNETDIDILIDFLDSNCEGRNNHNWMGVHRKLYNLMIKTIPKEQAFLVMVAIAERQGLDGMQDLGDL